MHRDEQQQRRGGAAGETVTLPEPPCLAQPALRRPVKGEDGGGAPGLCNTGAKKLNDRARAHVQFDAPFTAAKQEMTAGSGVLVRQGQILVCRASAEVPVEVFRLADAEPRCSPREWGVITRGLRLRAGRFGMERGRRQTPDDAFRLRAARGTRLLVSMIEIQ